LVANGGRRLGRWGKDDEKNGIKVMGRWKMVMA
jgi:hypothetical protein